MTNVLVVVRSPRPDTSIEQDRAAAYSALMQEAEQARALLVQWLHEQSLWDEVEEVGEPNAFNIIPVTSSHRVASLLQEAPGVEAVAPADVPFGLLASS